MFRSKGRGIILRAGTYIDSEMVGQRIVVGVGSFDADAVAVDDDSTEAGEGQAGAGVRGRGCR